MPLRPLSYGLLAAFPSAVLAQSPGPQWSISFGSLPTTRAYGAAADLAGGVYIAGNASAGLYGPGENAFLARFAPGGALIWGRQFGTAMENKDARSIHTSSASAIFVAGSLVDYAAPPYDENVFVTRFSADGDEVWERRFGSGTTDYANAVCTDGAGGAYITGGTLGSIAAPRAGATDCFLARYSGDGAQLWVRQFGTASTDWSLCAVPDGAGGVYVGGSTSGLLASPAPGIWDCWLARYNASGDRLWIRQFGTPSGDGMHGLCADGAGGLYACGYTYGSFGGPASGGSDAFVARLDANGQVTWVRQFGTASSDNAKSVSRDHHGGVYVFGDTYGALAQPQLGDQDLFLARYGPTGQQLWVRQWGTSLSDIPRALAPDACGGVYVAGDRTYSTSGGSLATLARFPGPCFPNCDGSTSTPILNVQDFTCFLQRYAAGCP